MADSELTQSEKQNPEQIKKNLKIQEKVVATINKMIRIRILILLWAYGKQSINDLCEKLDKSWPTINKHLGILHKARVVEVEEVKSRGPKNKKLYSTVPNLIKETRLGYDFLKLPPKDVKEILARDIKSDAKTLEIIKKVFSDLNPYHEELGRNLREIKSDGETLKEFYNKKHVNYYVETLDDEEFSEFYHDRYKQFLMELEEFRNKKKSNKDPTDTDKPYIAFHIILPIKEMQEARFKGFWNS
jgi:DNA-binding transcriptional ArsR family regulator